MENKDIIPFFGIHRQYASLREELLDATDRVYSTGKVLDGHYTKAFENAIAKRCDRKYAVAVNSCTQGLIHAIMSVVKDETKVMVPALSFPATLNAVLMFNHHPVFCDVDNNGLMDLESNDFALTGAGIGAILYANLFGNTVDWDRFKLQTDFFSNDTLLIIEDAAQSFGAFYRDIPSGKLGDVSVLSFDPTKNLPNYGSGGMVLTDNELIYADLLDLRDNGKHGDHAWVGTNSKMSEADCAQMLIKLKYFDQWQARRAEIANYYMDILSQYVEIVMPMPNVTSSWHKFVIRLDGRNRLQEVLSSKGVETKIHYSTTLPDLGVAMDYVDVVEYHQYREALAFTKECLSLPIYPEMTDVEVERVAKISKDYLR